MSKELLLYCRQGIKFLSSFLGRESYILQPIQDVLVQSKPASLMSTINYEKNNSSNKHLFVTNASDRLQLHMKQRVIVSYLLHKYRPPNQSVNQYRFMRLKIDLRSLLTQPQPGPYNGKAN